MADNLNWRKATLEEEMAAEQLLSDDRVKRLHEWASSLKAMRQQLGQILEAIEEFERTLA